MEDLSHIQQTVDKIQEEVVRLEREVFKIRRRMMWASVYGVLKLIIIVAPLVWSIWYFMPQLQTLYTSWQDLSSTMQSVREEQQNPDSLQELIDGYLKQNQGTAR